MEEHLNSLKPQIVQQGKTDKIADVDTNNPKRGLFVGADFNDPTNATNPNFDPQVFKDFKEEEVLRKLEDFKLTFLDLKNQVDNADKDIALSEIKVEELIKQSQNLK